MLRDLGLALAGLGLLALGALVSASRSVPHTVHPIAEEYTVTNPVVTDLYDPLRLVWKRGVSDRPEVVLTFDDGPHGRATERILDTLKAKGTPATFFVVGMMVERHPALARRMIAEGHEVGNHTYEHLRLDGMPQARIEKELAACEATIERATGRRATLMRPPGMRECSPLIRANENLGLVLVRWTIGAKDYVGDVPKRMLPKELRSLPPTTPEMVVQRVERQLKNGGIILLHDNHIVADALPAVIDAIHARGFTIVPAAKMLSRLPQGVAIDANPPAPPKGSAARADALSAR
ncbi:polysaccharide deacetylase family protein [bacterium]|nr:MAG: polysaccharide deacetylase family protein [bacterium]